MIRDASDSDLPCLATAMVRLQMAHARAYPEIYRRFETDDAHAHLSVLLHQANVFIRVAEHQGTVIGHIVFRIETKPETMFTHSQRFGLIAQIEVEPGFRRQGYGRALLADCESLAASHDLHRVVLDVWGFNLTAKRFFRSFGYDEFGAKLSRDIP